MFPNDELAESIEVRTGRGSPWGPLVLHAFARLQARPCRLLLLVVSFPIFIGNNIEILFVDIYIFLCGVWFLLVW